MFTYDKPIRHPLNNQYENKKYFHKKNSFIEDYIVALISMYKILLSSML